MTSFSAIARPRFAWSAPRRPNCPRRSNSASRTGGEGEYRRAAVASRRLSGSSWREARTDAAVVTRRAEAQRLADTWLQDLWAGRESAEFALSPRQVEIEPGDILSVPTEAGARL